MNIDRDIAKKIWDFIKAGTWVILILFFAYVSLFMSLLKQSIPFFDTYIETQHSFVSLVVNFGIIVLLVFDNSNKTFQFRSNRYVCASFLFVILMHGHARNCYGGANLHNLHEWLCTDLSAYILLVAYLLSAIFIRYLMKIPEIEERCFETVDIQYFEG